MFEAFRSCALHYRINWDKVGLVVEFDLVPRWCLCLNLNLKRFSNQSQVLKMGFFILHACL